MVDVVVFGNAAEELQEGFQSTFGTLGFFIGQPFCLVSEVVEVFLFANGERLAAGGTAGHFQAGVIENRAAVVGHSVSGKI